MVDRRAFILTTLTLATSAIGLLTCGRVHAAEEAASAAKRDETKAYRNNVSLVAVEGLPDRNVADPQVVVNYDFVNGRLTRREEILTAPNKQMRFEFGDNQICLNRYAITRWGDIVDIEKHAALHESHGEVLVTREDSSLILYRSNDQSFYRYDFRTQQHSRLTDPGKWALLAKSGFGLSQVNVLSPDGAKSVVEGVPELSEKTKRLTAFGGALTLCTLDGATEKLAEGFQSELSIISSVLGKVPVLWLDNERVLTQKSNGQLVILKMDGSVEPVVNIIIPELPIRPAQLSRDPEGRIIYACGESYVIDVENRASTRCDWQKLGHGFDIGSVDPAKTVFAIRYHGEEIGRGAFDIASARPTEGYLAVTAANKGHGSPREVQVWSVVTKAWTKLRLNGYLVDTIGWEEKAPD